MLHRRTTNPQQRAFDITEHEHRDDDPVFWPRNEIDASQQVLREIVYGELCAIKEERGKG